MILTCCLFLIKYITEPWLGVLKKTISNFSFILIFSSQRLKSFSLNIGKAKLTPYAAPTSKRRGCAGGRAGGAGPPGSGPQWAPGSVRWSRGARAAQTPGWGRPPARDPQRQLELTYKKQVVVNVQFIFMIFLIIP